MKKINNNLKLLKLTFTCVTEKKLTEISMSFFSYLYFNYFAIDKY